MTFFDKENQIVLATIIPLGNSALMFEYFMQGVPHLSPKMQRCEPRGTLDLGNAANSLQLSSLSSAWPGCVPLDQKTDGRQSQSWSPETASSNYNNN